MTYDFSNARVLVVDDMPAMLTLTRNLLNVFGFTKVKTERNGEAAFQTFCDFKPDLLITDWMMDPIDGLELTDMIRKNPKSPNPYIPIIMMTGFGSKLRVENARDNGITEFLLKPFASRDLYTRIKQVIEKPRQFVETEDFFGPDRRRKKAPAGYGEGRRKEDFEKPPIDNHGAQEEIVDILTKLREEADTL